MGRCKTIACAFALGILMVLPIWFLLPGDPSAPLEEDHALVQTMGQGAGIFNHSRAFAPLQERTDVLPWSLLSSVGTQVDHNRVVTVYPANVQALDNKVQRIQGYLMPLHAGEQHSHFLLSSIPLSCPYCTPGGPQSMVEVTTLAPIAYSAEPLVLQGHFALLSADPTGLYYRMDQAIRVK